MNCDAPCSSRITAAWSRQAVEESNLTVQIAALRKVLGSNGEGGELIVTPRHYLAKGKHFRVTVSGFTATLAHERIEVEDTAVAPENSPPFTYGNSIAQRGNPVEAWSSVLVFMARNSSLIPCSTLRKQATLESQTFAL